MSQKRKSYYEPEHGILRVWQVAEQLEISAGHARALIRLGEIPSVRYHGAIRVPFDPFADYLEKLKYHFED